MNFWVRSARTRNFDNSFYGFYESHFVGSFQQNKILNDLNFFLSSLNSHFSVCKFWIQKQKPNAQITESQRTKKTKCVIIFVVVVGHFLNHSIFYFDPFCFWIFISNVKLNLLSHASCNRNYACMSLIIIFYTICGIIFTICFSLRKLEKVNDEENLLDNAHFLFFLVSWYSIVLVLAHTMTKKTHKKCNPPI